MKAYLDATLQKTTLELMKVWTAGEWVEIDGGGAVKMRQVGLEHKAK